MKSHPEFYARVFTLAVAAALGYALFLIFAPFAGAICWAVFLAFLLFPLNARLRRRLRGHPALAAGLLTVLVLLGVLLPFSALSVEFVAQVAALSGQLQAAAARVDVHSMADLQRFPWIDSMDAWLVTNFHVSSQTVQSWLVSGTHAMLEHSASLGGSVFLGTVSSLFGMALTLVLL